MWFIFNYEQLDFKMGRTLHEKGVNAVMSAIYFGIDVDIQEGPNENRTIITQNNKLFPYRKQGTVPGESLINLVSLIQLTKLENS